MNRIVGGLFVALLVGLGACEQEQEDPTLTRRQGGMVGRCSKAGKGPGRRRVAERH